MVMRSVENARTALDDGKTDAAIKMMKSTDALCSRVVAPPTVHGLALRILADAYVQKATERSANDDGGENGTSSGGETTEGTKEGDDAEGDDGNASYVEMAKGALKKGIEICKVHEGKAGMPPFMVADLAGRLGDLYAALGEIFREEKNYKEALRSLRLGCSRFEKLGSNDFVAATLNRVAFCYMEKEKWNEALSEIADAERAASGAEAESAILSTTFSYKARCYKALDKTSLARTAFESALKFAMASGNVDVCREAEEFLAETQSESTVDDSAYL